MKKYKIISIILSIFVLFLLVLPVFAGSPINTTDLKTQTGAFQTEAGLSSSATVGGIVATVIKAFLGLLGIIFLALLIIAGYNYMLDRGNEDKVKKSLDTIRRAIIGLIIVLSAYAITAYVFSKLPDVGNTGGSSTHSSGSVGSGP